MSETPLVIDEDADEALLRVRGELEPVTLPQLRDAIEAAGRRHGSDLRLDLSDVTYLPSAALTVLATAVVGAPGEGAAVRLQARTGTIAETVLRISGLPYTQV